MDIVTISSMSVFQTSRGIFSVVITWDDDDDMAGTAKVLDQRQRVIFDEEVGFDVNWVPNEEEVLIRALS